MRLCLLSLVVTSLAVSGCGGSGSSQKGDATSPSDASGSVEASGGDTGTVGDTGTAGVPGDSDSDGEMDATDCKPNDGTVRHGAIELASNSVDDDCDGTTDEAALDTPFARIVASGAVGSDATVFTGVAKYVSLDGTGSSMSALTATVTVDGTTPVPGASASWDPVTSALSLSVPMSSFDLRAMNPTRLQLLARAQAGDNTYVGTMSCDVTVVPERVGFTVVDGVMYGLVRKEFALRALLAPQPTNQWLAEAEVAPGVWRFMGSEPPPTGTAWSPYLLYLTAGEHPETGGQAELDDFKAGATGAGYTVYTGTTPEGPAGTGSLIVFEATDLDGDSTISVNDLSKVSLEGFAITL